MNANSLSIGFAMGKGNLRNSLAVDKGNDLFLFFVSFLDLISKTLPWDLRGCNTPINNLPV